MENKTTIKWICATLTNDENSTDKEQIAYFVENGIKKGLAEKLVLLRKDFLNDEGIENAIIELLNTLDEYKAELNSVNNADQTAVAEKVIELANRGLK